jgi:hypothetical protein
LHQGVARQISVCGAESNYEKPWSFEGPLTRYLQTCRWTLTIMLPTIPPTTGKAYYSTLLPARRSILPLPFSRALSSRSDGRSYPDMLGSCDFWRGRIEHDIFWNIG